MRFCDLFITYKIGLKEIKSYIPFIKLPRYRKIAAIAILAPGITCLFFLLLNFPMATFVSLLLEILFIILFLFYDSRKRSLTIMLREHYLPHSKERMDLLTSVLQQYGINFHNEDVIDKLIEEAKYA